MCVRICYSLLRSASAGYLSTTPIISPLFLCFKSKLSFETRTHTHTPPWVVPYTQCGGCILRNSIRAGKEEEFSLFDSERNSVSVTFEQYFQW